MFEISAALCRIAAIAAVSSLGRALGAGAAPGVPGKQPLILSSDQRPVKAQHCRGFDDDGDFQQTARSNEHCAQAQQDVVRWVEPRRLPSRSLQNQQLMFQKKRFGNDRARRQESRS